MYAFLTFLFLSAPGARAADASSVRSTGRYDLGRDVAVTALATTVGETLGFFPCLLAERDGVQSICTTAGGVGGAMVGAALSDRPLLVPAAAAAFPGITGGAIIAGNESIGQNGEMLYGVGVATQFVGMPLAAGLAVALNRRDDGFAIAPVIQPGYSGMRVSGRF